MWTKEYYIGFALFAINTLVNLECLPKVSKHHTAHKTRVILILYNHRNHCSVNSPHVWANVNGTQLPGRFYNFFFLWSSSSSPLKNASWSFEGLWRKSLRSWHVCARFDRLLRGKTGQNYRLILLFVPEPQLRHRITFD